MGCIWGELKLLRQKMDCMGRVDHVISWQSGERSEGKEGLTSASPLWTAGASKMPSMTTRNARNTTYMRRVVMEDFAPTDLQQSPQAAGPTQQQRRSRHIMARSFKGRRGRGRVKAGESLLSQTKSGVRVCSVLLV